MKITDVRNKILCHNDLSIILQSKELGEFNPREDVIYFDCLIKFVSLLKEVGFGEPFVYYNLVENDIAAFMKCFNRGRVS